MAESAAPQAFDEYESGLSFATVAAMFTSVLLGVVFAVVLLPAWAPELVGTMFGAAPKAYWYLSRASGLVAYALLWLSMAFGLLMTNRFAKLWPGGPVAFDLHQYTSLLGLNLAIFHALILLGDKYIGYSLYQVLIPFQSPDYRPFWVGWGQVAFYGLMIVSLSFYVRKWLGRRLWRLVHFLSFLLFGLAFLHGIKSGTDSGSLLLQGAYLSTGVVLLFLSVYRAITAMFKAAPAAKGRVGP